MIEKIIIRGYRKFADIEIKPRPKMNIVVGDNETGKSTLLEAICLALTGKVNGKWAIEELNPFWFHVANVADYFKKFGTPDQVAPPEIEIELFLASTDADAQRMRGVHNSLAQDCPGVRMHIKPSDDYAVEFAEYMKGDHPDVLPTEFYDVEWRDFNDQQIRRRPAVLGLSFIDSRTIRSAAGVDYHTRQILSSFLDEKERAAIAVAHRKARHQMTVEALSSVNEQMAEDSSDLHDNVIGLAMDQSARASWETGVVPQVTDIPFAMIGQGQQAAIKVALAMRRRAESARFVLIEEPETHLSYSGLRRLISRIESLAGDAQQVFVTTHSSYVLNRLGIDNLLFLSATGAARIADLSEGTVAYFKHMSGYDTLRLVLASRLVLVEGASDEMVFERAFRDVTCQTTAEVGIDVIAMGGITFARALELCTKLDRPVVALQDNDGNTVEAILEGLQTYLSDDRKMCIGDKALGHTLEPQLITANSAPMMKIVLKLRQQDNPETWMPNHKTESALRILESDQTIAFPPYILEAVELAR
ncbi:AAA family ATPase [Nocardioides sp. NPDC006303]|uniref:ATP-dependent nuclease n=1 Tax=Nocardioides sp. NPDC006303 TaxID=3156747 RepID=UPI0033A2DEB6